MIYTENGKFFRVCDDCGRVREIKLETYKSYTRKNVHYCTSCKQKANRNHSYGKPSWNNGLTKETDSRVFAYSVAQSITKKGKVPWNKGLTKEDPRVLAYSIKCSITKKGVKNPKIRRLSYRNKSFRYFKKVLSQSLYAFWKRPILERDNFTCVKCGYQGNNLEVHHIKPFRKILLETSNQLNLNLNEYNIWSECEMQLFLNTLLENHKIEYGITYCSKCHIEVDEYRRRMVKKDR